MKRAPLVLAGIVVLSIAGGSPPSYARPAQVSPRVADFFGKDAVAVVNSATSIELARLRKDPTGDAYKIERVSKLTGLVGRAFQTVLLDPKTYEFPATGESDPKLCGAFEPAAVVRFTRSGKPPVDVILSIKCTEGGMATGPALPKRLTKGESYAGWPKFKAHMGPGDIQVLGLLVRTFPDDYDLKAYFAAAKGE